MKANTPTVAWDRNVTTQALSTTTDTYIDYNFYFNLNMSCETAKSSGMTSADFSATQDDEVDGINIYLYNYKASELYVKNISISKYIAPTE